MKRSLADGGFIYHDKAEFGILFTPTITSEGPNRIVIASSTLARSDYIEVGVAVITGGYMNATTRPTVRTRVLALLAVGGAILFFMYDIVADVLKGEFGSPHFIIELIVFAGVSMSLVVGLRDLHHLRVRLDREEHRNQFFSNALAETIDEQMDEWRLTRSEKDVAWFIIKGYRFSEIADARGVKESTTRLQATSLYAKAGVSGRAEFVAEILQPLLASVPIGSRDRKAQSSARADPP